MTPTVNCRKCGAELPADSMQGLCPRCVFKAALGPISLQNIPAELSTREPDAPCSDGIGHRFFGDYELLDEVARGGMGVVFKARQLSLDRIVAIKMILSGQFANDEFIQRFRTEAATVASLQHPNIVAVHEVGENQGQHYFSMDYVEGASLADLIREKPMAALRAARYVKSIAEAIQYAHQRGTIHRDLKPSNVLIDASDNVRITDFGLAKQMKGESDITLTGQVLGSPNYLPPEQASGKRGEVGIAADIYSMGAILYHLLTGRPPFVAETLQATLLQVMHTEPVAPRLLNPDVPLDLETICLKCLEKELANRYAAAGELAEELGRFLRDEPILARPVSPLEKSWRWCRRNPVIAGLSTATLFLLIAVAVGSPIAALRIDRERHQAALNAEQSRQRLVRLNVANGVRALTMNDPLSSLPWFAEALRLEKGHRDQEEIQKIRIESILEHSPKPIHCWFLGGTPDTSPLRSKADASFSPDGKQVLTVSSKSTGADERESEVTVWNISTGEPAFRPIKFSGNVYHAAFSRDGRWFVTASGVFKRDVSISGEARVWDAQTGAAVSPPFTNAAVVSYASFSSDGKKIVVATRHRSSSESLESDAYICDAVSGALLVPPLHHTGEVVTAQFSPDDQVVITSGVKWHSAHGEQYFAATWESATGAPRTRPITLHGGLQDILYRSDRIGLLAANADRQPEARLYDAATGELMIPPLRHESGVVDAVFSPDGSRIVTASSDYTAQRWEASSGRPTNPPLTHGHFVRKASFSLDGHRIVTSSFDGTARVWDARMGRALSPPLPHGVSVLQATFSPDGRRVLTRTIDQAVRLWEFARPEIPDLTIEQPGPARYVQFSPDGTRILTAGADGAARVTDAITGRRVIPPLPHNQAVTRAFFSQDARLIATASEDYTARVWNAETGKPITPPLLHNGIVWSARLSPDNRRLVTASGQFFRGGKRLRRPPFAALRPLRETEEEFHPAEAIIWNVNSGERLFTLMHSNTVTCAEFNRDGTRIVTASIDKTARVWDATTGKPITPPLYHSSPVLHAAFSPDGRRVVTSKGGEPFGPGAAQIWDATTGEPLIPPMQHSDGVLYSIFSPDGLRVATASSDNSARIWDALTGEVLTPLLRHPRPVTHLAFSPDGKLLATASSGNHASIWDGSTGEPLRPPMLHPDAVMAVAFSPDGRRVATGCRDGRVRLWDVRPYRFETDDLILWTQVLSARQIERTGTDLEPLSSSSLSNAWHQLRSKASRLRPTPRR